MSGEALRFACADPPYYGCCNLYGHYHPDGRCWDDKATHAHLIDSLRDNYPDGWALSMTSGNLLELADPAPAGCADRRLV